MQVEVEVVKVGVGCRRQSEMKMLMSGLMIEDVSGGLSLATFGVEWVEI